MNEDKIRSFILEASRATYASGDESVKKKQADGSTTIQYENGEYKYHDNYFGGEPYGGREVVFFNNKAIWMMVYYGFVHEGVANKDVYSFLIESLSNANPDMPYRGPKLYTKGEWKYENNLVGNVDNFSGIEKIYHGNDCIYEASYMGGLIDK
jgi:hypothetical protein